MKPAKQQEQHTEEQQEHPEQAQTEQHAEERQSVRMELRFVQINPNYCKRAYDMLEVFEIIDRGNREKGISVALVIFVMLTCPQGIFKQVKH